MEQIRAVFHYLEDFNTVTAVIRILLAVIAGGVISNERGVMAGRRASARIF